MSLVKAIDVASFQPRDLSTIIAAEQPAHVIVHLYHDQETPPWGHSAAQVQSARDNGCTVGGYCFLYPQTDMVRTINSVADRCASIGLVLPILWLDVETYNGRDLTPGELRSAVNHCDALGIPCGIYTSREMWRRVGNPDGFESRPAWIANYNGTPWANINGPANLPNVVGHQYRGDPLDLSLMLLEYTVVTPPDPCAAKLIATRATLDAWLARKPFRVRKAEVAALRAGLG